MTTRERFHAVMNAQPFDRLPVVEWAGWWKQTIDRWHEEKLPEDVTDRYDIARHFGLDLYYQTSFANRTPACPSPERHGSGILRTAEDYDRIRPELLPTEAKGHLVISCDHQTPPGVSYDDYQLYLRLFREYADEAGRLSRESQAETGQAAGDGKRAVSTPSG